MKKHADNSLMDVVKSGLAGIATVFKKGPAEKLGEKIDNAVRKAKDAIRDTTDSVEKDK